MIRRMISVSLRRTIVSQITLPDPFPTVEHLTKHLLQTYDSISGSCWVRSLVHDGCWSVVDSKIRHLSSVSTLTRATTEKLTLD